MSSFTPKVAPFTIHFESKPTPVMEALEGILIEKGLPFMRGEKGTLTIPDDGLIIQIKHKRQGETAVYFTAITTDNAILARRISDQLGEIFTEVLSKAPRKKRRNRILLGCVTAVFLCLAVSALITTRFYRAIQPPPLLWRHDVQGDVYSRPIIANNAVYFGTLGYEDSYFSAVNLADGTELWKVSYGSANIFEWADSLTSTNLILFSTDAGDFYALNALTGEEAWVFEPKQRGIMDKSDCDRCTLKFGKPMLADDVVYVPSHDHHLYALDATTGQELWRFGADGTFLDTPSVAGNFVYAGNLNGNIYILDAKTGQEQGRVFTGRAIYEALPDGDMIYVVLEGGGLRAFDIHSGERVWQLGDGADGSLGGFSGYMALHDDKLFVMSSSRVYAVTKETGELAWDFSEMQRGVYSDYTLVNGRFYVGDGEGYLYILDANDGDLLHRFNMTLHDLSNQDFTADRIFTPAIHNGNAYFGWMGHLYAIETQSED